MEIQASIIHTLDTCLYMEKITVRGYCHKSSSTCTTFVGLVGNLKPVTPLPSVDMGGYEGGSAIQPPSSFLICDRSEAKCLR